MYRTTRNQGVATDVGDDSGPQNHWLTTGAPSTHAKKRRKPSEFDAHSIGIRAYAMAVDPRVPPEEVSMGEEFTGTRALHAKVVLLEGDDTSLAFFGSANFTNRGWGFRADPHQLW